jgi:hypothetical protein
MKKLHLISSALLLASAVFLASCEKEDEPSLPVISFKQDNGYVYQNTAAGFGDTLNFSLTVNSNGTDNLVRFQVLVNEQSLLDSTINTAAFAFEFYSTKSILDKEVWKFVATDFAGNVKTDSITITGDFGPILSYAGLTFGAQNNTTAESFASYANSTATMYFQADAFNHQADIDMFCFYENTASHVNLMTLAAPGSNITGIFTGSTAPDFYTTKNITFFCKTTLTPAQFDAVANDAMILASFDSNNKFKKAKLLTVGDVYAFMLQSGKYGLFKVTSVEGTEAGTLGIAVKIQQ